MTDHNAKKVALDWRTLTPPQAIHHCDCEHCDMDGDLEPIKWPELVRAVVDGVEYVTDKYLFILAEHAPIPDGYEGPVIGPIDVTRAGYMDDKPLLRQARGVAFRWQTIGATDQTGWQIRWMEDAERSDKMPRKFAVFAANNETQIGWAISAKVPDDDAWSDTHTREYGDTEDE